MPHGNILATLAHYFAKDRSKRSLAWNLRATNLVALKHRYTVWLTALMSPLPNAIVAVSQPAADFHLHHGYRPKSLKIIHNGVDTDKFHPNPAARAAIRDSLGIGAEETVAIHVARLDPMKNHGLFLEAIQLLPQIRGLLVGAGTETLSLPKNALALGLRRDVDALYASADIVVSTSSYGESFGNVIAEGMSTGCIPIATDVGLFRYLIDDTGRVIAPNNRGALVAGLEEIIALNLAERTNRKGIARARIVENFSIAKMIDDYAAFYTSFVGGPLGAELSRR
jgi:glycosyltransferase involved in cell wall biosynthesis